MSNGSLARALESVSYLALFALVLSASGAPALAQSAAGDDAAKAKDAKSIELAPIVVSGERANGPVEGIVATRSATASKTDTPIIEIPRAVNVVPREQIEQQQAQTVGQTLRYEPGITLDSYPANGIFDFVTLRGYQAPMYLDGLSLPSDSLSQYAMPFIDPYLLERVEVLRGPSSALYGGGSPGGLVNMVSKQPTATPQNEVFVTASSPAGVQTGFDSSGPIDRDGDFLYRIVGKGQWNDGEIDYTHTKNYFIAPSITWTPDTDTTLTVSGGLGRDRRTIAQQFVPLALTEKAAPFGRISRSTYLGEPGFEYMNRDMEWIGYSFEHKFNDVFTFRSNLRFDGVQSENQLIRANGMYSMDGRTVQRTAHRMDTSTRNLAFDNQIEADFSTGPIEHKLLGGLDYQWGKGKYHYWDSSLAPIDAYDPIYGARPYTPDIGLGPMPVWLDEYNFGNRQSQFGLYAQDQIKYDRLTLDLGIRYDRARNQVKGNQTQYICDLFAGLIDQSYCDRAYEVDSHAFTYNAGLTYQFDNGLAPYVNYATSFEPPTGYSMAYYDPSDGYKEHLAKPTTGEGYEVGVKYQPTGSRTMLQADLFQLTKKNILSRDNFGWFYAHQTGEARIRGLELEARSSVTDNLDVIAAYSHFFSAKATKDDIVPEAVGKDIVNTPKDNASLWAMYTWHEGALGGLSLGGGVRYTGSQYIDIRNADRISGYTLFDAALKYDFGVKNPKLKGMNLQVNVSNLFNKYYVSSCATSTDYCGLGQGRQVFATLSRKW